MSVLDWLKTKPESFLPEDLDWITEKLIGVYNNELNHLINSHLLSEVSRENIESHTLLRDSFKADIQSYLNHALKVFLFEKQHWKNGHNIDSYVRFCLKNFTKKISDDIKGIEKVSKLICPACKLAGAYELLIKENNLWRCLQCTKNIELNVNVSFKHLSQIFSLHSRKGFECSLCKGFIPFSACTKETVSCPYSDCSFFGEIINLKEVNHPSVLNKKSVLFDHPAFRIDDVNIQADSLLELQESLAKDSFLLKEIITSQLKKIKINNKVNFFKVAMYQAYLNMLNKQPEDMITYLIYQQRVPEFPIQPQIFQEYIFILENSLPFYLDQKKKIIVCDLLDSNLNLFAGKSIFITSLKENNILDNETTERYYGRTVKDYGPCFFGKLLEVKNLNTNKSLLSEVEKYSFTQIKLFDKACLPLNTKIEITHCRLIPHYEIGHMIYLQRIRNKIVDKINVRKK